MPAMEPVFPPPADAALFYVGSVMHARMKPKAHRFAYSVFALLVDLDRLEEAHRLSPFFSVRKFNLIGFDHGPHGLTKGSPDPKADVVAALKAAGMSEEPARVLLLCYPRVLGFVFNPLSVYFAYAGDGRLIGVQYEVRNTFGQRHSYVEPVMPGQLTEAGLRQEADKLFYVSPFMPMEQRYHFRIRPPGARDIALRIHETDAGGPILAATFHGHAERISARSCLRLALAMPLMTLKVVAGIHWEALRLWVKGVRLVSRPEPPPPASHGGQFLTVSTETTRRAHHAG
ncbi:MAG: DUF1365 domain-containing protein [Methylobacterium sp.]|nr:MAG: DUF1365 domain-containing protein [Methylobacterium sp.]